jgi:hypothetical protein
MIGWHLTWESVKFVHHGKVDFLLLDQKGNTHLSWSLNTVLFFTLSFTLSFKFHHYSPSNQNNPDFLCHYT